MCIAVGNVTRSKVVSQPDLSVCPVIRDSNSVLWKPGEQSRKPASQVGQDNQPADKMLAAALHLLTTVLPCSKANM